MQTIRVSEEDLYTVLLDRLPYTPDYVRKISESVFKTLAERDTRAWTIEVTKTAAAVEAGMIAQVCIPVDAGKNE